MTVEQEGLARPTHSVGLGAPRPRRDQGVRDRVIDAAVATTAEKGWSAVTMGQLAEAAGVSRQTVYNDIGTKSHLAEALIRREVERFLACVTDAFATHGDLLTAIEAATRAVLERSADNQLIHAIVSATHGADTELLPHLMGPGAGLLGYVRNLIRANLARFDVPLPADRLEVTIDVFARSVLSQTMQPSGPPHRVAADLAWVYGRLLGLT